MKSKFHKYKQGYYNPIQRNKCENKEVLVYRSNLELQFMQICDRNPNIIKWASEHQVIRYFNTVKNRYANYFVDFSVILKDGTKMLVEVKPFKEWDEIKNPHLYEDKRTKSKKKKTTLIYEAGMRQMNIDKWNAAEEFCEKEKILFRVFTEKDLEKMLKFY